MTYNIAYINKAKTAIIEIRVILNLASDFEPTFECK